jgi:hypothetical protein
LAERVRPKEFTKSILAARRKVSSLTQKEEKEGTPELGYPGNWCSTTRSGFSVAIL